MYQTFTDCIVGSLRMPVCTEQSQRESQAKIACESCASNSKEISTLGSDIGIGQLRAIMLLINQKPFRFSHCHFIPSLLTMIRPSYSSRLERSFEVYMQSKPSCLLLCPSQDSQARGRRNRPSRLLPESVPVLQSFNSSFIDTDQACDICRQKKIRCDVVSEVCAQCIKNKTTCHFTPISMTRAPRRSR